MMAASMFSGIGGAELALPEAEWLWCAEIEKFPSAVLAQRLGHPNLGDITAPDFIDRARAYGPLDLLCGGPPCQAFSIAGLRNSMADARGNLSLRFIQVAHDLADTNGLRNLLVENVPGWLNTPDNAFGCFLGGLVGADDALLPCKRPAIGRGNDLWAWRPAGRWPVLDDEGEETGEYVERESVHIPRWPSSGMVAGPRARAAWRVLDAQYAGLAQRRQRVILVADFGDGADPAAVLFERRGLHGNHPPRRETGQGVTGTLSARTQGGGGLGTDFDLDGGLQPVGFGGGNTSGPIDVDACLRAKGQRIDFEVETFIADVAGTMPAGGNATGGDRQPGMSVDTADSMLIAFFCKDHGADATDDMSPTLRAMGHAGSHANAGGQMAVAFDTTQITSAANGSNPKPGDPCHPLAAKAHVPAIVTEWAVRRLTVVETERLQGYPDGWTMIEFGSRRTVDEDEAEYLAAHGAHIVRDNQGRLRTNFAADGPRYKAIGNAWAFPCIRPVALAIMAHFERAGSMTRSPDILAEIDQRGDL
jgi:DNA (cytosine-5)-methyltransferase 1